MSCFVTQIDLSLSEKLREGLRSQGFELFQPAHTLFQGKKPGITCTLYASGKLMVQGKKMQEFIEFYLEPEILGSFTYSYESKIHPPDTTPRIGVDESGKGDFFGPLCIAGVYGNEKGIGELANLGVKDSKKLNDVTIMKVAKKIREKYANHIVVIGPKKYNELYERFGNLNLLLGWGHATVIQMLIKKTKCDRVIIDQFAAEHVVENALKKKGQKAHLTQRHRGEEDLVVAAASILARAAFVASLEKLGNHFEITLPKGANHQVIRVGKQLVSAHGPQVLEEVGKLHFKTRQEILNN